MRASHYAVMLVGGLLAFGISMQFLLLYFSRLEPAQLVTESAYNDSLQYSSRLALKEVYRQNFAHPVFSREDGKVIVQFTALADRKFNWDALSLKAICNQAQYSIPKAELKKHSADKFILPFASQATGVCVLDLAFKQNEIITALASGQLYLNETLLFISK